MLTLYPSESETRTVVNERGDESRKGLRKWVVDEGGAICKRLASSTAGLLNAFLLLCRPSYLKILVKELREIVKEGSAPAIETILPGRGAPSRQSRRW